MNRAPGVGRCWSGHGWEKSLPGTPELCLLGLSCRLGISHHQLGRYVWMFLLLIVVAKLWLLALVSVEEEDHQLAVPRTYRVCKCLARGSSRLYMIVSVAWQSGSSTGITYVHGDFRTGVHFLVAEPLRHYLGERELISVWGLQSLVMIKAQHTP